MSTAYNHRKRSHRSEYRTRGYIRKNRKFASPKTIRKPGILRTLLRKLLMKKAGPK